MAKIDQQDLKNKSWKIVGQWIALDFGCHGLPMVYQCFTYVCRWCQVGWTLPNPPVNPPLALSSQTVCVN